MKIFIDMDQVLNDFVSGVVSEFRKYEAMKDLVVEREDLVTYEIMRYLLKKHGVTNEKYIAQTIEAVFNEPGFWENIPVYPGAPEALKTLCSKHDVYIATSPWISSNTCLQEKREWIRKNLDFFNLANVIYINKKGCLSGDVIIEDSPNNLSLKSFSKRIAIDYPYNRNVQVDFRTQNWNEVVQYINSIE